MKTPVRIDRARVARATCAAALTLMACAPGANAFVSDQEAQTAADAAVAWFATKQNAASGQIGGFGGDWAMVALAGAGVNAADLRSTSADPSLQDYFHGSWADAGPGTLATDQARAILVGETGGIQTAKLSAGQNLIAKLATFFDGAQLGSAALINDDVFGVLALDHAGPAAAIAPTLAAGVRAAQTTKTPGEAGWNFSGQPSQNPDVDMTGAGIAALCAAGADADDPAVSAAVEWLRTKQDQVSGGIVSSYFGANSDSTSWVVNGLRQCGIDPQGPEWTVEGPSDATSADDRNPLDFMLSLQKDNGAFVWAPGNTADNLYSTQGAVTALVGDGFGHATPPREDPTLPVRRPAPEVADGTPVPLTLVLDHGDAVAGAERLCSVTAPVGASVAEALEAAAVETTPAECVSEVELTAGEQPRLASVNGIVAEPGASRWEASVDGAPSSPELRATVGLGATVMLSLEGDVAEQPEEPLPPVVPVVPVVPVDSSAPSAPVEPAAERPLAKAKLTRRARLRLRSNGGLRIAVRCPRGVGSAGCRGMLAVKYRVRQRGAGPRYVTAGRTAFVVGAGKRELVVVVVGRRLRRLARNADGGRRVRLEATVRDDTAAVSITRTQARVRG